MRGFDSNFWFGGVIFVLLLVFVILIAKVFQINVIIVFLISSTLLWLAMDLLAKRLLQASPNEAPMVYCEWENRLNDLDFDANQKTTISDLQTQGFTLEEALGKTFLCHTEPNIEAPDLYFEGIIVRNDADKIVMRALNPIPLLD